MLDLPTCEARLVARYDQSRPCNGKRRSGMACGRVNGDPACENHDPTHREEKTLILLRPNNPDHPIITLTQPAGLSTHLPLPSTKTWRIRIPKKHHYKAKKRYVPRNYYKHAIPWLAPNQVHKGLEITWHGEYGGVRVEDTVFADWWEVDGDDEVEMGGEDEWVRQRLSDEERGEQLGRGTGGDETGGDGEGMRQVVEEADWIVWFEEKKGKSTDTSMTSLLYSGESSSSCSTGLGEMAEMTDGEEDEAETIRGVTEHLEGGSVSSIEAEISDWASVVGIYVRSEEDHDDDDSETDSCDSASLFGVEIREDYISPEVYFGNWDVDIDTRAFVNTTFYASLPPVVRPVAKIVKQYRTRPHTRQAVLFPWEGVGESAWAALEGSTKYGPTHPMTTVRMGQIPLSLCTTSLLSLEHTLALRTPAIILPQHKPFARSKTDLRELLFARRSLGYTGMWGDVCSVLLGEKAKVPHLVSPFTYTEREDERRFQYCDLDADTGDVEFEVVFVTETTGKKSDD